MKVHLQFVCLLLAVLPACRAQVVDRMVAVVNKQVILQSQLDQALRVQFLMEGKPLRQMTLVDAQAALDRLVDQALLDQQIMSAGMTEATPEELAARLKDVRAQLQGPESDEKWNALLADYGLTQQDVETQLAAQLRLLKFIDLRFRGMVHVDKSAIEAYYSNQLLPELRKQGASVPPLNEVSGKIEKILAEQRIDELMTSWLQNLRAQSRIEKMLSAEARQALGLAP